MKYLNRSTKTYILYVLIPIFIITILLYFYQLNRLNKEYSATAKETSISIMQPLDTFLTELSSDLALLGTAFNRHPDLITIEETLQIMNTTYSMEADFFYIRTDGEIVITSNPTVEDISITELPFFQYVQQYKEPTISTYQKEKQTFIISAYPKLDSNNELEGIIVGFIPSTYLASMKDNSKHYLLEDELGRAVVNQHFSKENKFECTTLSTIPWKIYVEVQPISILKKLTIFLTSILFITPITHFLYLLIYFEDRQKRKEKDLQERLDLVATVAGTLAHEIRNPLTGIQGFLTLLKENRTSEEEKVYFSVIETEVKRINTIVSEFLILGRPTAVVTSTYSMQYILQQIIPIIEQEANQRHIHVQVHLPTEDILFICNKDHIKQLILNLSKNGIQAMNSSGVLSITLEEKKESIILSVQDTGSGIPLHRIDTIFEPFITTKEEGTGLGLVVCKQIVETYHGTIQIDSHVGVGTTFQIILPKN